MESSVGAQVVSTSLLLVFTLPSVGANLRIDPLCISKFCFFSGYCRVAYLCDQSHICTLQPVCIENGKDILTYHGCPVGMPLLRKASKKWTMAACYPGHSCPDQFYCKLEKEHGLNTCCRSNREHPHKPGVCGKPDPDRPRICVDTCLTDSDCPLTDKCCEMRQKLLHTSSVRSTLSTS